MARRAKFHPADYPSERYRACVSCRQPAYRELFLCERCHRAEEQRAYNEIEMFEIDVERNGWEKKSPYRFRGGLQSSIMAAYMDVAWRNRHHERLTSSEPPMRMKPRND
jgi:hypothetical protein